MGESEPQRKAIVLEVVFEEGLALGRTRLNLRRKILRQELDLLHQPAADDRVILIETHSNRFTIQNLFSNPVFDEIAQLDRVRLSSPLPRPGQPNAVHVCLSQSDCRIQIADSIRPLHDWRSGFVVIVPGVFATLWILKATLIEE